MLGGGVAATGGAGQNGRRYVDFRVRGVHCAFSSPLKPTYGVCFPSTHTTGLILPTQALLLCIPFPNLLWSVTLTYYCCSKD